MHLLDPKLDIVFKMLMVRNPDLIRAQLEAILGEPVLEFEVLNPEIPGDLTTDKYIVLDLRVRLKSGKRVDVEMQARTHDALTERVLYYAARDYGGQLPRGADYSDLTATVSVLWVDARLFPGEPRFHLRFELLEMESHARFTDHLVFHVLQLPEISSAFPAAERALHNWGRFFAARDEQTLAELAEQDETMANAVKALEDLSQDPEARWMARDREDSAHFYRMGLERSRQQGFVEGRTEGFVEGRTEGFVEGRTEIQKETVAKLCAAFGIELTDAQRTSLDDPKTDLDAIIDVLIRERRWP